MKSKFRIKIGVLCAVALLVFMIIAIAESTTVQGVAFAIFFVLALVPYFIRCEKCGWGLDQHLSKTDQGTIETLNISRPLLASQCPKCGIERY